MIDKMHSKLTFSPSLDQVRKNNTQSFQEISSRKTSLATEVKFRPRLSHSEKVFLAPPRVNPRNASLKRFRVRLFDTVPISIE